MPRSPQATRAEGAGLAELAAAAGLAQEHALGALGCVVAEGERRVQLRL